MMPEDAGMVYGGKQQSQDPLNQSNNYIVEYSQLDSDADLLRASRVSKQQEIDQNLRSLSHAEQSTTDMTFNKDLTASKMENMIDASLLEQYGMDQNFSRSMTAIDTNQNSNQLKSDNFHANRHIQTHLV